MTDGGHAGDPATAGMTGVPDRGDPGRRRRARGRRGRPRRVVDAAGDAVRVRDRVVRASSSAGRDRRVRRRRSATEDLAASAPPPTRSCSAPSAARSGTTRTPTVRPEQALFALRGGLGLFANLRPVTRPAGARRRRRRCGRSCSTGVDLLIVRELTGGVYFGDRREAARRAGGDRSALDTLPYHEREIARVVRLAFELARTRRGRLTQVDKANVLATSRLWRQGHRRDRGRVSRTSTLNHQLVDSCAMLLVRRPADFDVLVTENLFGDILSDEAAVLAGTLGDAAVGIARRAADGARPLRPVRADPRLRAGHRRSGRREPDRDDPVGGDAAALSLGHEAAADAIEAAVGRALDDGLRTADLARPAPPSDAAAVGSAMPRRRRAGRRPRSRRPVVDALRRRRRRRGDRVTATDAPVVLYDTTLRDGTQGENITLSLADKLRIARMLDEYGMPYIEGGWPGSNPKDIEFFAAARTMRWETREARRVRLDPPSREPARATTRTCASSSPPRRRS